MTRALPRLALIALFALPALGCGPRDPEPGDKPVEPQVHSGDERATKVAEPPQDEGM
jgi:hypothetical protein